MSPIAGWRILLPRQAGRRSSLLAKLEQHGAVAQAIEMISVSPPAEPAHLDSALLALAAGDYTWIGFTSVNAVTAVVDRSARLALVPAVPANTRIASVGPATGAALKSAGLPVDLVPAAGGSAESLANCWPSAVGDESVLLPGSSIGQPDLAQALQRKGFRVDRVTAYRTRPLAPPSTVVADLTVGAFSAVVFTSPSTVSALAGVPLAAGTLIVAIGPTTARAATDAGFAVTFTAASPTDDDVIAGLLQAAAGKPPLPPRAAPTPVGAQTDD